MRYDAERKARTRDTLLKEAGKAIRREGPQGVSVVSLMASAGLTHGGFYAHFTSKEALVAESIDASFADASGMYLRATEGFPPDVALRRYLTAYLSERHRDARETGCPLPSLGGDISRMDGAVRERFGAGVGRLQARLQALLEALGSTGAEELAASLLAEIVGALSIARAMPPGEASDAVLSRSRDALLKRCGLEPSS